MKTEFLLAAQAELQEAIAYYDAQLAGLGFEFSDEVERAGTHQALSWGLVAIVRKGATLSGESLSIQRYLRGATRAIDHCGGS
jgi:hypothetical protein